MRLFLVNKNCKMSELAAKKVLNLCIYGSIEKYLDCELNSFCEVVASKQSNNFKKNYLKKIDNIACEFIEKAKSTKEKSVILSYRTFSKLAVSDNLIDKFWVVEQIEFFKMEDIIILIDDIDLYRYYSNKGKIFKISSFLPYKQFYYFLSFLVNKYKSPWYTSINEHSDFSLFIGNKFEKKRNFHEHYDEYFYAKYWRNSPKSLLLLNIGEWRFGMRKSNRIIFKETFLSLIDLINLFIISIKHFYCPIQVSESCTEDFLINLNLQIDVKSGAFIDAFSNFYIYSNIYKAIPPKSVKLVFPHEGRVYEKIICTIFNSTKVQLVGYAHFPVSERILNYHYGCFEGAVYRNFMFFTLSKSNLNTFVDVYNWPVEKVKIGAHLKHKLFRDINVINKNFDILLLLGNELVQNIRLVKFIELTTKGTNFSILVRLHPALRDGSILMDLMKKSNFIISSNSDIVDDIALCKLIAYGDTGASIDCLSFNLPLCYIYDDTCLLSDRIHDSIEGHYRFYHVDEFREALPFLILNNVCFSFDSIIRNYISSTEPQNFLFE